MGEGYSDRFQNPVQQANTRRRPQHMRELLGRMQQEIIKTCQRELSFFAKITSGRQNAEKTTAYFS